MDRAFIENLILKHEGKRNKVYTDTTGNPTAGIGWNLNDSDSQDICDHFGIDFEELKAGTVTLTDDQINQVFDYQLTIVIGEARGLFPAFDSMPNNVQAVIVDMSFNMGLPTFKQFKRMIAALNAGNWKQAALDAGQSLWAQQVPNRAKDDMELLNAA